MSEENITYSDLTLAYAMATQGTDEPEFAMAIGSAVKHLHQKMKWEGDPVDVNGNPIYDHTWYTVSKEGIIPLVDV